MFRKNDSFYGVGVNYRSEISNDILENIDKIDLIEVFTEKFFIKDDGKILNEITSRVPTILHGLDMSIGSSDILDQEYLSNLKIALNSTNFEWFSDHISLTKQDNIELGHLMPVQFSEESVDNIVEKAKYIANLTKKPFLLENITYYYSIPGSELKEDDFIKTILEKSDCGMLLDVNNLYINSVNHGYDPKLFLQNIPLDRVVEIHMAGGSYKYNMLIDTHANAIAKEVWDLFDYVVSITPVNGVIIERDSNLPNYTDLLSEVEIARNILRKNKKITRKAA